MLLEVPKANELQKEAEPIEKYFNSYIVTLIGYCTDNETNTMTLLMHNFSLKFKK